MKRNPVLAIESEKMKCFLQPNLQYFIKIKTSADERDFSVLQAKRRPKRSLGANHPFTPTGGTGFLSRLEHFNVLCSSLNHCEAKASKESCATILHYHQQF